MEIRKIKPAEYKKLAAIHEKVFPSFFMTSLGIGYLKDHYKALLKYHDTIAFAAVDDDEFIGFVMGRADSKNGLKKVVKAYPMHFAFMALKLMVTKPLSLIRVVKNLSKVSKDKDVHDDQHYAEIGLIGVCPGIKGKGIGHSLFKAFCEEAKKQGAVRVSLTTDLNDNELVLKAYDNWGFKEYYKFISYPDRQMVRLIKSID